MLNANEKYMIKISEAMTMFSRGRNRIVEDAINANAYVKIGRSRMIIVDKMKKYYEGLATTS